MSASAAQRMAVSSAHDVGAEGEVDGQQIRELVTLLTKEEVVRKVTQGLALERLGLSDLATAQVLLTALQQVCC